MEACNNSDRIAPAMTPRPERCGIAAFVKTPGLSPIKTRLARTAGAAAAEEFYELSVNATEELLLTAARSSPDIVSYWAVAEEGAASLPRWSGLPVVPQGSGGLGERLDRVYKFLVRTHGAAIVIGSDSPQLEVGRIVETARHLAEPGAPFVAGPAGDGGFYLFGGTREIPWEVWTGVEYSSSSTLAMFTTELAPWGSIELLQEETDVDAEPDLETLARALRVRETDERPALKQLCRWLEERHYGR